jgi:hypothetical protein
MTYIEWLVLDNLQQHWPHNMDMKQEHADAALSQCILKGWAKAGCKENHAHCQAEITDAGAMALLTQSTKLLDMW